MTILTTVADAEQQASSFSNFIKGLTWEKALPALIVLVVSLILIKVLTSLFDKAIGRSKIEKTLHPLLHTVFKALLTTIALLIVTGTLGLDVSVLVAILSVISLAISLAVQGTLSNVVGGLVILTSHPFRVGDYIDLAGTAGTVQRIGLTYTDLRTPGNQDVHVPNSQVSGSTVTNFTAAGTRRMELTISASYDDAVEAVKAALLESCQVPGVLEAPAPEAHLSGYGDSAISYILRAWAPVDVYWEVYYAVLENVKAVFDARGITMTYPHVNVHMQQ